MGDNDFPLTIVAALADNGVIGLNQAMPWDLPGDRRHFRERTWGKPMLMGRKTFESIGRALPGRETIVLTRDETFAVPGVLVAHDLEGALVLAHDRARIMGAKTIILVGGGELFAALLPRVERLELTLVEGHPKGDTFFPPIDWSQWEEEKRSGPLQGPNDTISYQFVDYHRKLGAGATIHS